MAFRCGFFNAVEDDRVYRAEDFGDMFDGLITDGIYATIGNAFAVIAGGGMSVRVRSGRAWFNNTWNVNESDKTLMFEMADLLLPRIDAVVLEVDTRVQTRDNALKIIKGSPAVTPQKPVLYNSDGLYQHPLAYVTIPQNSTSILATNIENVIGIETPFVTGILESISIAELWEQWRAQFLEWFNGIKEVLSGNIALNLQKQIDECVKIADKATQSDVTNKTSNKWVPSDLLGYYAAKEFNQVGDIKSVGYPLTDSDYYLCNGSALPKTSYPSLFEKLEYGVAVVPQKELIPTSTTNRNISGNIGTVTIYKQGGAMSENGDLVMITRCINESSELDTLGKPIRYDGDIVVNCVKNGVAYNKTVKPVDSVESFNKKLLDAWCEYRSIYAVFSYNNSFYVIYRETNFKQYSSGTYSTNNVSSMSWCVCQIDASNGNLNTDNRQILFSITLSGGTDSVLKDVIFRPIGSYETDQTFTVAFSSSKGYNQSSSYNVGVGDPYISLIRVNKTGEITTSIIVNPNEDTSVRNYFTAGNKLVISTLSGNNCIIVNMDTFERNDLQSPTAIAAMIDAYKHLDTEVYDARIKDFYYSQPISYIDGTIYELSSGTGGWIAFYEDPIGSGNFKSKTFSQGFGFQQNALGQIPVIMTNKFFVDLQISDLGIIEEVDYNIRVRPSYFRNNTKLGITLESTLGGTYLGFRASTRNSVLPLFVKRGSEGFPITVISNNVTISGDIVSNKLRSYQIEIPGTVTLLPNTTESMRLHGKFDYIKVK